MSTCGIVLLALSAGALFGQQDLSGTWQGTLPAAGTQPESRIVLKISKDAGTRKGVLYRIDQGPQPVAATIAIAGTSVKVSIPSLVIAYEGKLDVAGGVLTGKWTAGSDAPIALNLKRLGPNDAEWPIPEPPAPLKPMAADAHMVFEAASIRPSDPAARGRLIRMPVRELSTTNYNLYALLAWAYGYAANQLVGGQEWMASDRYDIVAKPEAEGKPSPDQWKAMVQNLLADRFQLKFHLERKELQVYALRLGKNGHKLVRSADQSANGSLLFQGRNGFPALPGRNTTMDGFANLLQRSVLDHPVVNQTGLEGKWDFLLWWTPDETQFQQMGSLPPLPADQADAPPDIFTAFQEQLGLKLVPTRAPVDVMVIDHVAKPSAN